MHNSVALRLRGGCVPVRSGSSQPIENKRCVPVRVPLRSGAFRLSATHWETSEKSLRSGAFRFPPSSIPPLKGGSRTTPGALRALALVGPSAAQGGLA